MAQERFEESARLIDEAFRLLLPLTGSARRGGDSFYRWSDLDLLEDFGRLPPEQMKIVLEAIPIIQGLGSKRLARGSSQA